MAGLAEAVQGAVGQPASVRIGIVESVAPLVITAQGVQFEDIGILGDYAPQLGDSVALLGQSSEAGSDPASWLVLGVVRAQVVAIAPIATLRQTSPQPILNGTSTPLEFDVADVDNAGGWDPAAPTRWTAPVAGYYQISGGATFELNATGARTLHLRVNGGDQDGTGVAVSGSAAVSTRMPTRTVQLFLEAGHFVQMVAFQSSGVTLDTQTTGNEQSTMEIRWVRPPL